MALIIPSPRRRSYKLARVAILTTLCGFATAQQYPGNFPNRPLSDVDGFLGYAIQLSPGESVTISGSFDGKDTGCGIYVHNVTIGVQVFSQVHPLAPSQQAFSNVPVLRAPADARANFVVSVWTFIGGPPHIPGTPGWHQIGPEAKSFATIPGIVTFSCKGSTHGSTKVTLNVK
jgi:hypothetical protein